MNKYDHSGNSWVNYPRSAREAFGSNFYKEEKRIDITNVIWYGAIIGLVLVKVMFL